MVWWNNPGCMSVLSFNSLRTDGDFCRQRRDTEIEKKFRLLKHTDMTIHWKALEEHFLMVPLVFWFTHFRGGGGNRIFRIKKNTSVLKEFPHSTPEQTTSFAPISSKCRWEMFLLTICSVSFNFSFRFCRRQATLSKIQNGDAAVERVNGGGGGERRQNEYHGVVVP
jgi:hypothetical protein